MQLKSTLNLSVAAVLGCILITSTPSARADTIILQALRDATLFGASPANNNSSSGPGMSVGSDNSSAPRRGLIAFDIASFVPAGSTITSASLSLVLGMVVGSG